MANTFSPLEGDNNVLLFNQDTFTVSRFKYLVEQAIVNKLQSTVNPNGSPIFSMGFCNFPIGGGLKILLNELQWCNHPIDCELLKVGSQGWQKGKLRIQVDTKILYSSKANETHVYIEFCPDEPTEPESPLDDLRQLPEYKQQS